MRGLCLNWRLAVNGIQCASSQAASVRIVFGSVLMGAQATMPVWPYSSGVDKARKKTASAGFFATRCEMSHPDWERRLRRAIRESQEGDGMTLDTYVNKRRAQSVTRGRRCGQVFGRGGAGLALPGLVREAGVVVVVTAERDVDRDHRRHVHLDECDGRGDLRCDAVVGDVRQHRQ